MSRAVTLILTSIDSHDAARNLARSLVESGLAACVQITAAGTSVFRWQGKLVEESEFYLQLKTVPSQADHAITWLQHNHPYDVPEIIRLDGDAADAYGAWLAENTG